MPLLTNTPASSLWIPTSSLGTTRPFGLASSPDGRTLYVSCVGGGTNGKIIAIDVATKAVTDLVTGLSYVKHALAVDSAGAVYYATSPGARHDAGNTTVWKLTGGTSTAVFTDTSVYGMEIAGGKFYHEYRVVSSASWLRRRDLTGTHEANGGDHTEASFAQERGVAVTDNYVVMTDRRPKGVHVWNRNTMAFVRHSTPPVSVLPTGAYGVSDTEIYILGQEGYLNRYDATTGTFTSITTSPNIVNTSGDNRFAEIHITAGGRCFLTAGGWAAINAGTYNEDGVRGTDTGIYELETTYVPPFTGGPTVGFIGFGTF